MKSRILLAAILAAAPALAQKISGPVTGYVSDPAGSVLQPVLGIRGAAIQGEDLPLDPAWSPLGVTPTQEHLLVSHRESGVVLLVNIESGSVRTLDSLLRSPDRVYMSPNGTAAVVRAGSRVQIVTGLPDAPAAGVTADLSAIGPVTALAVSDDGANVLISGGSDTALYSLAPSGDIRWLAALGQNVRIAFSNRGRSAAIAGIVTNDLWIWDDVTADFSLRRLAGADNGISSPVGVAFSDDNRGVLAAHGAGVTRVALADSSVDLTPCACTPALLERVKGNTAFRLTGVSDQPMWIFDGSSATAQVWFVPPRQAPADRGQ